MSECSNCDNCIFTETLKEIYYENHITVKYDSTFEEFCKNRGIKVVHIDMGEEVPHHLMTSHTNKGERYHFMKEAMRLSELFYVAGYEVQRVKVETVPWHPYVDKNGYFECHLAYGKNFDEGINKELQLHKSKNLMKQGDHKLQMYTHRCANMTHEEFKTKIDNIVSTVLSKTGILPNKQILEYAIYDSNESMDNEWLNINKI